MTEKFYQEILPFFGGDKRAKLYMQFFVDSDTLLAKNLKNANDLNDIAMGLIDGGNYQGGTAGTLAGPFADFLATVASIHNNIDNVALSIYQKNIIDNVYKKWDTLEKKSQVFYWMYSFGLDATGGVTKEIKDVVKVVVAKDYIEKNLICLCPNKINTDPLFFQKWYDSKYATPIAIVISDKFTGLKLDFLLAKLLANIKNEKDIKLPTNFGAMDKKPDQLWVRTKEQQLYRNDGLDKKDRVYAKDYYGTSDDCYGTNLSGDLDTCNELMFDCIARTDLNSSDLDKCIKTLEKANYDDAIKSEIKKLSPMNVLRLLENLGFRQERRMDDVAKVELNKVQCVEKWFESVKSKLPIVAPKTEATLDEKVKKYLAYLVDFVNANPGILNKNYAGVALETLGETRISANKYAGLTPIYNVVKSRNMSAYDMEGVNNYRRNLRGPNFVDVITRNRPRFNPEIVAFYDKMMPFGGINQFAMFGGGIDESKLSVSADMKRITESLLNEMQKYGKTLGEDYLMKITQLLNWHNYAEKQIIKNIKYIQIYVSILKSFKDYETKTISESQLNEIIRANTNLVAEKYNKEEILIKIWDTLNKLANGVDTKHATVVGERINTDGLF